MDGLSGGSHVVASSAIWAVVAVMAVGSCSSPLNAAERSTGSSSLVPPTTDHMSPSPRGGRASPDATGSTTMVQSPTEALPLTAVPQDIGLLALATDPSAGFRQSMLLFRVDEERPRTLFSEPGFSAESPHWSHDGMKLAFIRYVPGNPRTAQLEILNVATGATHVLSALGPLPSQGRWISGDEQLLTSTEEDGEPKWIMANPSSDSVQRLPELDAMQLMDAGMALSPSEPRMIAVAESALAETPPVLMLVPLDGSEATRIPLPSSLPRDCSGPKSEPAWSPDGTSFAV